MGALHLTSVHNNRVWHGRYGNCSRARSEGVAGARAGAEGRAPPHITYLSYASPNIRNYDNQSMLDGVHGTQKRVQQQLVGLTVLPELRCLL